MTAPEIRARLTERIASLVAELLPNGRREGSEWVAAIRDERSPSLKVHLVGDKAGVWCDFGAGDRGDALDLVAFVRFSGDIRAAMKWAAAWLGEAPARFETSRRGEVVAPALPAASSTSDLARQLWGEATSAAETPVSTYLASRGLRLPPDASLRFHPAAWRNAPAAPAAPR